MPAATGIRESEASSRQPVSSHEEEFHPMPDLLDYMKEYARQKPEVAALWCFGIGFVLGWKLKPW